MAEKKLNKTSASVGYAGNIEIKIIRGEKVVKTIKAKNEGKRPLFNFLAGCLIGNYDAKGTPKYIMLGHTTGNDDTKTVAVSTNAIPYSGVSVEYQAGTGEGEGLARAIFKFLIPFSSIPKDETINCIRLYNSDLIWNNHCAYFILNADGLHPEDEIKSDGKSNILITWTMTISNQIKVEESV